MPGKQLIHSAFVCVCGAGQLGDDGVRTPGEARSWDGKTVVAHYQGDEPKCPNAANHNYMLVGAAQIADAAEVQSLKDRLAVLEAKAAGSSASSAASPASDPFAG